MLFKATIPFLLLISSGLAAPTVNQVDTLEARDAEAAAPATADVKRNWKCILYSSYNCPIPCGDGVHFCNPWDGWHKCAQSGNGYWCYN